jgi:hypothetical protein
MTTATSPKSSTTTSSNGTAASTGAAQPCCQGSADAWRTTVDAAQAFWSTVAKAWNIPASPAWTLPAIPTLPAAFEASTAAMNAGVDSAARFTTELSTLAIDTLRHNARAIERAADLLVSHVAGRTPAPSPESARQVWDESVAFSTKAADRLAKAAAEHGQRLAHAAEQALRRAAPAAPAN